MRKQQYYQPQQQYADPGIVDFGQIQMYNPQDTANLVQAGQAMQQRWDTAQSNIAKYWEDLGAANLGRYRPDVEKVMTDRFNDMEKSIQEDYQSDYGRAANTVIKSLSKDRALMHQGTQAAAKVAQAEKEFQDLKAAGKAPVKFVQGVNAEGNPTGKPVVQEYTFEDWHGDKFGGVRDGKFVMPELTALRGRGEHDKWTKENISDVIMKGLKESTLQGGSGSDAYLQSILKGGMSDAEVQEYFNSPDENMTGGFTTVGDRLTNDFLNNSKFAKEEFTDENGNIQFGLAKNFLEGLVKAQTVEIAKRNFVQDPEEMERIKKEREAAAKAQVKRSIFAPLGDSYAEINPWLDETQSFSKILQRSTSKEQPNAYFNLDKDIQTLNNALSHKDPTVRYTHLSKLLKNYPELEILNPGGLGNFEEKDFIELRDKLEMTKNHLDSAKEALDKKSIDTSNMTYTQLAQMVDNDNTLLAAIMPKVTYINNDLTLDKMKQRFVSGLSDMAFSSPGVKSVQMGFKEVAAEAGIDDSEAALRYITSNKNLSIGYNKNKGSYFIDIPTKFKSNGDVHKDSKRKKIYFVPDQTTKNFQRSLETISSAIHNNERTVITATDGLKYNFRYDPQKNLIKKDNTEKKIALFDINNNPIREGDPSNPQQVYLSLSEMQQLIMVGQQDHLFNKYTKDATTFSDQKQNPDINYQY